MSRFPVVVEGQATRIHLCGRLIVELQGRRLEESLRGRQGRLLFAYLALNRDRPVRPDELAEALWSGKGTPPPGPPRRARRGAVERQGHAARVRVAARAAALAPAQGARPGCPGGSLRA